MLESVIGGIPRAQEIDENHIMALLFYTNFDSQSAAFSRSFRKLSYNETNASLKKRHSYYANWAKLLRECVTLFGCGMDYSPEHVYYHGISVRLWFESTRFINNGPMSTTAGVYASLHTHLSADIYCIII